MVITKIIIITAMIASATHPPAAIALPISSTVAATAFAAVATQKNSRRLAQAVGNGYTLSFTYNDEGIRTTKTVNSTLLYLNAHKRMESPAPKCGAGLFKNGDYFIA